MPALSFEQFTETLRRTPGSTTKVVAASFATLVLANGLWYFYAH
jgi:hypothetical protein